jgi:tetratricopeptide (TPR) repeat protein
MKLRENYPTAHFNLLTALNVIGDKARLKQAAINALPVFERHNRLNPDDYYAQVQYANILELADRREEAIHLAHQLIATNSPDGFAFYNLGCLLARCGEYEQAVEILRTSIAKGFSGIDLFRQDSDLDPLRKREDFQALINELELK